MTTWLERETLPALETSQIHIWKAHIRNFVTHYEQFRMILDAGELARADGFLFDEGRLRYVVAHGIVRMLLAQYAEQSASALRFGAGSYGKPFLVGHETGGLTFNLSHSSDVILVAIGRNCAIGVDVEHWSERVSIDELDRIADVAFSARERATLRSLEPGSFIAAFYATWTRKEAYLKSTGAGIAHGLEYFDVSCASGDAQLIADRLTPGNADAWRLHDLPLKPGYSAALAIDDFSRQPLIFTVTPALVTQLL